MTKYIFGLAFAPETENDNLRSFIIPLFSFDFQERIIYFNGTMIFRTLSQKITKTFWKLTIPLLYPLWSETSNDN